MDIDYELIGRKVYARYPLLCAKCLSDAELTDLDAVAMLYGEYKLLREAELTKTDFTRNRMIFIAAIVKLYDPAYLICHKKLRRGLRDELSRAINCEASLISHYLRKVKDYLVIYTDFRMSVSYVYGQFQLIIDERQADTKATAIL